MEFLELAAAVAPQVRQTRNLPADAAGVPHPQAAHRPTGNSLRAVAVAPGQTRQGARSVNKTNPPRHMGRCGQTSLERGEYPKCH